MSKKKDNDYKVGYKKPPKSSQFKPGQSGNPKGRAKGTRNFHTDFMKELHTKIEIAEGGKKIKISKQRALIKRLMNAALNGDTKATNTIVPLILDFSRTSDLKDNAKPLTEQELALLSSYMAEANDEQ